MRFRGGGAGDLPEKRPYGAYIYTRLDGVSSRLAPFPFPFPFSFAFPFAFAFPSFPPFPSLLLNDGPAQA
ncbi:hypothetical protein CALCODRAFT_479777 [Calocera cornea HHB12733]|uniref:Uncharacterized protein n=1 Tax=Calocera cornea HHB12733 TaxID=1353952 RepID=A0A165JF64_9BASI|nr:hypothetical protein CALCODRAFT_479777 [Calocera cornea HHB12733]